MAMVVDNAALEKATEAISKASDDFEKKGSAFIGILTSALSTFEGEAKDALMEKKIGTSGSKTEGTLAYFLEKQVPDLLKGLSDLLEGNRDTVVKSDQKLADAIRGNGNG